MFQTTNQINPVFSMHISLSLSLSNFLVFQGQGRIIPFFTGTSLVEARDVVTVGQTEIFELRNPLPWNNAGPEGQVRQQTCGGT